MAGFGRTGKWFACEHWDVVPDILTVAKGINSGYVPLGAMIDREQHRRLGARQVLRRRAHLQRAIRSRAPSAVASIEAFQEEGIVENAAAMGEVLGDELPRAAGEAPVDRRGARARASSGARARQEPRDARAARAVQRDRRGGGAGRAAGEGARWSAGLYLMTHWNVIMVAPPLTITREELDEGLGVLDEVLIWLARLRYPDPSRRREGPPFRTISIEAPTAGAATQLVSDLVPFARTDVLPARRRALGGLRRGQHRGRARRGSPGGRALGVGLQLEQPAGARRRRAGRASRP